jgi:hypothetical protein
VIKPFVYEELTGQDRQLLRDVYIKEQSGLCCHCGNRLDSDPTSLVLDSRVNRALFPENFFTYPIHLHHDHDTGLTIGAVHARCNAVLWEHHGE